MAKHLKQQTTPIFGYLQQRFALNKQGKSPQKGHQLSPALQIAYLQGEALLRQRFFNFLSQRHINDPKTQLHFWEQFLNGAEVFALFCQTSGLIKAFKSQISEEYIQHHTPDQLQYRGYCCLLWELQENKESSLLHNATERLFAHYISAIFPKGSSKQDPERLKREIRKHLAEQWQVRPEIKESYTSEDESIQYSLIAKISGYHPKTLITINGKRLKPTRLEACKQILDKLQRQTPIKLPASRTPNKSQPPVSL